MSDWRPFEPCAENMERAGDRQCRALAFRSGWNACRLVDGHDGPHQDHGGSSHGRWGTREEVQAFLASQYSLPTKRGRR